MQTWAKRGLQTALVTGGLLMLGTGIASADEDVNPDKPASPLDGNATVPVHMHNNQLGTPLGTRDVPDVRKDAAVRTSDVTRVTSERVDPHTEPAIAKARQTAGHLAQPSAAKAQEDAASSTDTARDQAALLTEQVEPVKEHLNREPGGDKLAHAELEEARVPAVDAQHGEHVSGNRFNVDLVAPVDFSGNAIAVVGNAETDNDSGHDFGNDRDVVTTGAGGAVGGNVVDADWALPVQITNNAVAVFGMAYAEGTSSQAAWATGDTVTDGTHGVLGGNVVAPQLATPVQVDGNAVAGGGSAGTTSTADSYGEAGGSILTSGENSTGGGNAVPVPVAVPVKANGNAVMATGKAVAESYSTADAVAGATRTGMYGVPTYAETNGDPALAAGNIVAPSAAGPVLLCGNAGGVDGIAHTTCETSTDADAGGVNRTTGAESILSGSVVSVPAALPVAGFGNPAVVLGEAGTDATNTEHVSSGGEGYTRGHGSTLSGTTASVTPAGPIDVFANPVAAIGKASTTAENTSNTDAGGYHGTTGDDSVGGGNMGTVPVTMPAEAFGNTAAAGGTTDAVVTEYKTVAPSGVSNTSDDNGLLASNLVNAPVAGALQAFGNSVGALAVTRTAAVVDNRVTSGGPSNATGHSGIGSGNIAQTPTSLPVQLFGNGATAVGKGSQAVANEFETTAGGAATSDGANALGGGNVLSVPTAGAGQVFGETVAVLGKNRSLAGSITDTEAGGDTATTGADGLASGNVVSPQLLPVVQSFAVAASGPGGVNGATATNQTDADSGGDVDTNGDESFVSGNVVDTPAGAQVQPFGDAVSTISGKSHAQGLNDTNSEVGGSSNTSGPGLGAVSGVDMTTPFGADVPVYDVPVDLLARAMTNSLDSGNTRVGEEEPSINLPISGALEATELPSFMRVARTGRVDDPAQGTFSGILGEDQTGALSGLAPAPVGQQVLPTRASRADVPPVPDLGEVTGPVGAPQVLPVPAERANVQVVPSPAQVTGPLGAPAAVGRQVMSVSAAPTDVPGAPDLDEVTGPVQVVPTPVGRTDVPVVPGLDQVTGPVQVVPTPVGRTDVPAVPSLDQVTGAVDVPVKLRQQSMPPSRADAPAVPNLGEVVGAVGTAGSLGQQVMVAPTSRADVPVVPGLDQVTGAVDLPVKVRQQPTSRADVPVLPDLGELTGPVGGPGAVGRASRADVPALPELGELTGPIGGSDAVEPQALSGRASRAEVPGLGDVTGPVGVLGVGGQQVLPGPASRADVPVVPGLDQVMGAVDLPVKVRPASRADAPAVPELGGLTGPVGALGAVGQAPRTDVPGLDQVSGAVDLPVKVRQQPTSRADVPGVSGLGDVTGPIGALGVGGQQVLPGPASRADVPALPDLGELTGPIGGPGAVGQASRADLPDLEQVAGMAGVPAVGSQVLSASASRSEGPGAPDLGQVTAPLLALKPAGLGGAGRSNNVPVEVLALAMTESVDSGAVQVDDEPSIHLPATSALEATEVPSLLGVAQTVPSLDPGEGVFSGVLGGLNGFDSAKPRVPGQQLVDGVATAAPQGPAGRVDVPAAPGFGDVLSVVQQNGFGGFGRSNGNSPLEFAPDFGDLDATTIIPVLRDVEATQLLPVIPGGAPVLTPAIAPRVGESTLDSTRAALANLFATRPIG